MMAKKDELYELSYETGATKSDSWIDIEGGAGTLYRLFLQRPPRTSQRHDPDRRRGRKAFPSAAPSSASMC